MSFIEMMMVGVLGVAIAIMAVEIAIAVFMQDGDR